ncbi:hypothetical protein MAPG_07565 [Magnaporthiopsis poae ATCC 64411]|uniref:Pal1 cell morphology protein n=1 Tax=Magnaporthiopsis poae (strain ATCC 64411 / 73-15) TaxID=644358 RepID=A0A0C4E506_MAGP6|nr:hypothetical protein MAPG_07565 [Magnaporthiopsis poae ATCC 64411]
MGRSSDSFDKQWAKKYILDPLTAPEPNQECGPGSSFASPPCRRTSFNNGDSRGASSSKGTKRTNYPSPPSSTSPSRSVFRLENPFSDNRATSSDGQATNRPAFGRSNSSSHPQRYSDNRSPANLGFGRSQSVRQPPSAHQNRASGHARSSSTTLDKGKGPENGPSLRRSGSLTQRFPGDMSHRPLDMIKRDVRAADRAPHLRKTRLPDTDTIDGLDTIGGTYHHGGPYDATLISRNTNKMYSPVEAVKDSNMEALKATPKEYINDSLVKHVPLQGTAMIPPGGVDMTGNVMRYEEGADLMREPDAPGGAYKRWDGIPYHPNDLKGKGEPSYTIERDLKQNKALRRKEVGSGISDRNGVYEMQPRSSGQGSSSDATRKDLGAQVRHRSISSAAASGSRPNMLSPPISPDRGGAGASSTNNDLRRSNTTGRRITEGLKRRFGSFRRKRNSDDQ